MFFRYGSMLLALSCMSVFLPSSAAQPNNIELSVAKAMVRMIQSPSGWNIPVPGRGYCYLTEKQIINACLGAVGGMSIGVATGSFLGVLKFEQDVPTLRPFLLSTFFGVTIGGGVMLKLANEDRRNNLDACCYDAINEHARSKLKHMKVLGNYVAARAQVENVRREFEA